MVASRRAGRVTDRTSDQNGSDRAPGAWSGTAPAPVRAHRPRTGAESKEVSSRMAFTTEQLDAIGSADEVHISTYRPDGSRRNALPIWTVRIGDDLYIRSALGPDATWYRTATKDNRLHIEANSVATDVTLHRTAAETINAAIDAAYRAKYPPCGSSTTTMVTAPATETTVKLAPAERN